MKCYQLMNGDDVLADVVYDKVREDLNLYHFSISTAYRDLASFGIHTDDLTLWVANRMPPETRRGVFAVMERFGITSMDGYVNRTMLLSLDDTMWLRPAYETNGLALSAVSKRDYDSVDMHKRKFNRGMSYATFTGDATKVSSIEFAPEFSTVGETPKFWKRINSDIILSKGNYIGSVSEMFDAYNEFFACQLLQAIGVKHVNYTLGEEYGKVVSRCKAFTSSDIGFIPAATMLRTNDIAESYELCRHYAGGHMFRKMVLFDSITYNYDRHFGNFGFLMDNRNHAIKGVAPIFDNGCSLFGRKFDFELEYPLKDIYVGGTHFGLTFDESAKAVMDSELYGILKKLSEGFRFEQHPEYKIGAKRFEVINSLVNYRIKHILSIL